MKKIITLLLLSLTGGFAFGNGVTLSNLTSVSGSGFVQLQFDLSWKNSWNNTVNFDATWVFFKFKDSDGTWRHLNVTGNNIVIATGFSADVPSDNTGVMIHRNVAGLGAVTLTNIKIGINNLPGSFDVSGFALEMVQIPLADPFYLGDGSSFSGNFEKGTSGEAYLVNTNSITMGTSSSNLNSNGGFNFSNGTLATGFPIGYNSAANANMYMMKHEITQAAYRDFLNTLSYNQQASRTNVLPTAAVGTSAMADGIAKRMGIQIATSAVATSVPAVYGCNLNNNTVFNEADDGEWIGCGALSWMDLAAFLDWAALRPMTELEFEKSCRGPLPPVAGEYASGTKNAFSGLYTLTNPGATNENTTYTGSVLLTNINQGTTANNLPFRVGMHATPTATRISAGAGYYGCLDLSGNISEMVVTIDYAAGKTFTGKNGDGELTPSGYANEDFWPGINGNTNTAAGNGAFLGITGVTGSAGFGSRGGSSSNAYYQTSYRSAFSTNSTRFQNQGGRGVKSW